MKKTKKGRKNKVKKTLALIFSIILVIGLSACSSKSSGGSATLQEETYTIEIEIEKYGTITAVLDAKTAPITVSAFVSRVKDGFYNGLTFHRVYDTFMIQGGDPNGNGLNDENLPTITGEFAYNGVENNISHKRGTLSMARSQSYNSASSQFFIVQEDSPHLDGQYASFGKVTSGMELVDKVCKDTPVIDDNGSVAPNNQPVIKEIRIVKDNSGN
ncbi:MAG: peptidylprolyl isomerase [Clostridia bacterium]|nr:peptidylprolyl isomerase [Clostridia bacterium]